MQCGYLYARDHGYDVAVQVDGDGQHDPRDIPRLLAALEADPRVEMVTGSRFLASDGGYRSSPLRRVGIRVFAALMSLVTRQRVTDPTSGLSHERAARRSSCSRATTRTTTRRSRRSSCCTPTACACARCRSRCARARAAARRSRRAVPAYYMVKVLLAVLVGLLRARPDRRRRASRDDRARPRHPRASRRR